MFEITVQRATTIKSLPTSAKLKRWARAALQNKMPTAELTIRIVDSEEITELNHQYRNKHKPTNVLSFPFEMPDEVDEIPYLGDIIICAEVIKAEAHAQQKTEEAHWAHIVIHGTLHVLGYDHEKKEDAERMEAEEIKILKTLGFDNPYRLIEGPQHE